MNDDINKTQTEQDIIGQTVDTDIAEDQSGYHVHDLDDKGTSEQDVLATDPDHFADDVLGNRKDRSQAYDDSADPDDKNVTSFDGDPDDVVDTDLGGVYERGEAVDEDGASRPVGTPGLIGGDDDTD